MELKLKLIVSKGCAGCKIMESLIKEALSHPKYKDIIFEINDIKDVNKRFIKENRITDVPTTCYMINNIVKFSRVGTAPAHVIQRWIDVQLIGV